MTLRHQRDALLAVGSFYCGTIRVAGIKTLATALRTSEHGALRQLRQVTDELEALSRRDGAIGDALDWDWETR
jgi:hypothetical protein